MGTAMPTGGTRVPLLGVRARARLKWFPGNTTSHVRGIKHRRPGRQRACCILVHHGRVDEGVFTKSAGNAVYPGLTGGSSREISRWPTLPRRLGSGPDTMLATAVTGGHDGRRRRRGCTEPATTPRTPVRCGHGQNRRPGGAKRPPLPPPAQPGANQGPMEAHPETSAPGSGCRGRPWFRPAVRPGRAA